MHLLSRRRSVLDFLNNNASNTSNVSDPTPNNKSESSLNVSQSGHLSPTDPRHPARPVSEHGNASHSRLSHEVQPEDISDAEPEPNTKPAKRFSLMKLKNFSESQLGSRVKLDMEDVNEELPPVPAVTADGVVPTIVKTAPTAETGVEASEPVEEVKEEKGERTPRPSLFKRASSRKRVPTQKEPRQSMDEKRSEKPKSSSLRWRRGKNNGLEDLHRLSTQRLNNNQSAPPSYGDESNSSLAIPVARPADPRVSESAHSDGSHGSSGDGQIYGSTTTTTHTVSTYTTFFRLPRRNKNRNSLFPLPVKLPPPNENTSQLSPLEEPPGTPRASTSLSVPHTPKSRGSPDPASSNGAALSRHNTETNSTKDRPSNSQSPIRSSPNTPSAKNSLAFAEPGPGLFRRSSQRSQRSVSSLQPPMRLGFRERSSTTSSYGRLSEDIETPPPLSASGRNSTSTNGRSSFGGLLTLSRFRQGSDPNSPRHGSPGTRSKSNSFAMSREPETIVVPEREEGDTPGKYLERLEAAVSRSLIAGILSKSADPFAQAVLRSYTRRFMFFGEPIDMSLRKFLLEAELPKETQQVDRVIQAFADRYHECNPGIFTAPDQAYIVAFSIMMLHTDAFNKNNKRKMQRQDYIKNTSGQGVSDEILACFYDNICYTPFVHFEEEVDINGEKVLPFNTKRSTSKLKSAIPGADGVGKKASGPVDPYILLVDQKLDHLRPSLNNSIGMDDPYNYIGSSGEMDIHYLQRAFTHTGVLQIISARSRPAAYESQAVNGEQNPVETQQGIVDLKITKVGILWRKAAKKKKARSPWQEWGAILTGSQLYLFRDAHWAKGLLHQFLTQQRLGRPRTPVVFKPPLHAFKPDALIKTDNAVALVDSTYTRHKHAFTFVRTGGQEEVFLADNEAELNDWLGLINYAAAFRAAGVRIRGMLGGAEEDPRAREIKRLDSTASERSAHSTMSEVAMQNRGLSPQLQRQVMAARRQIMVQKVGELENEFTDANRQLEQMLRNARHLLVLAPIPQKSREDVVYAAARADAMIKWLRRDIWRMKCHRDILALDTKLDSLSASELEKLVQEHAQQQPEPESATKKDKPKMLTRLSSAKPQATRSPPRSPPSITAGRPSTAESLETFIDTDVFRTPPESSSMNGDDFWRLPTSDNSADVNTDHRPSVTSTMLSASPHGNRNSLSLTSSLSSASQPQRNNSSGVNETVPRDGHLKHATNVQDKDVQTLARAPAPLEPAEEQPRKLSIEDAGQHATPDSKHKSGRKSMQKTLRDATHHHPHRNSTHKHKRNKDSDSTVRSGGGADEKDAPEDGTPGLARDKPRFILHGKQASVIQFGGDWERMKLRREQYNRRSGSPSQMIKDPSSERHPSAQHEPPRNGAVSPIVHDFTRGAGETDDETSDEDDVASLLFREDAEVAAAFAGSSASPPQSSGVENSRQGLKAGRRTPPPSFDLGASEAGKRLTVIGPSPPSHKKDQVQPEQQRFGSPAAGADATVRLVSDEDQYHGSSDAEQDHDDVFSFNRNENRRTVIGPSTSALPTGNGIPADMEKREISTSSTSSSGVLPHREPLAPASGTATAHE